MNYLGKFKSVSFKTKLVLNVSFRPPLLLVIVAQPYAADSIAVLPKGSCHLEQTTEIELFL